MKPRDRENVRNRARLRKRSVRIGGHDTSVSLEDAFWDALGEVARARGMSVNALVAAVDRQRRGNLSSALRLFVLESLSRRGG
jgi:predicted DNA-binding ribbon-helix-helix protein